MHCTSTTHYLREMKILAAYDEDLNDEDVADVVVVDAADIVVVVDAADIVVV
jgi:hypothetical protein